MALHALKRGRPIRPFAVDYIYFFVGRADAAKKIGELMDDSRIELRQLLGELIPLRLSPLALRLPAREGINRIKLMSMI